MCGIAGVIALDGQTIDLSKFKSMVEAIRHRGKDGEGYLVAQSGRYDTKNFFHEKLLTGSEYSQKFPMIPVIDKPETFSDLQTSDWDIALGHRRLSIIDLTEAGFQPMSDLSKQVWLVFNGEIYNYQSIKAKLIELGYVFKSHTDTEVIIYAYIEWGIDFIHQLNGMFAFALLDKRHHQLYLVRDRYGIKPLYYIVTPENNLLFASEIKALLAYNKALNKIDLEALAEYFTFQNIFTDKTFIQSVSLLPAGHLLHLNLSKPAILSDPIQYWDICFHDDPKLSDPKKVSNELQGLFEQAVDRQLVSDVEVGCYLSGGIDSGAITAVSAKKFDFIKSFTVGFDLNNISGMELSYDEREKAEMLSYLYKTEHYEMVLKSGDMERCLNNFSWHLEEPRVGQSYPNYYAAKLASKFVKVVLSGTGGDELFGGYPWRYQNMIDCQHFEGFIDHAYGFWQRLMPSSSLPEAFAPIWSEIDHIDPRGIFRSVFNNTDQKIHQPTEGINYALYFEFKTFLHGLLLIDDKLSMSHSLETRVPFLDNDLVDFASRIPVDLKLGHLKKSFNIDENDYKNKQRNYHFNHGKFILRQALKNLLPEEFISGKKQGFSSPDASWFKGDSIRFVKETLLNKNQRIYDYLNYHYITSLVLEHLEGKSNHRLLIWSLINFHYFLKQFT